MKFGRDMNSDSIRLRDVTDKRRGNAGDNRKRRGGAGGKSKHNRVEPDNRSAHQLVALKIDVDPNLHADVAIAVIGREHD